MEKKSQIILADENETIAFARKIAKFLKPGDIVNLSGELGAGKTTFARGVVLGLGGDENCVHSPTFSISHEYECPTVIVNHCDFYRLPEADELEDLGGLEFFFEPKIYLIEWLNRINVKKILASRALLSVDFKIDAGSRIINFPEKWNILD